VIGRAARPPELAPAFAAFSQAGAGAVVVAGAPSFSSQRPALIQLSARHSLPAIYDLRDFVVEGGLVSYSGSFTDAYRQAGIYAGKILRGDDPADLPVQQPTRFELVINMRAAKSLGLTVPPAILVRADAVIE
jgi:putative ABC transport system substrate-binding protein